MNTTANWKDELLSLLECMNAGQNQNWDVQWRLYDLVLSAWGQELSARVVAHAALNLKWRPAPAELREIAARLESPFPDADMALDEVCCLIRRYGRNAAPHPDFPNNPNIRTQGAPSFSHPIIAATVRRIGGWDAVCGDDSQYQEGGFQGNFRAVYGRVVDDWKENVSKCLDQGTRPMEFFPDYTPFAASSLESVSRLAIAASQARNVPVMRGPERKIPEQVRRQIEQFGNKVTLPVRDKDFGKVDPNINPSLMPTNWQPEAGTQ